ncbi:MAG: PASTA domain-containing protein [Gaiellaceae bacterium]
MILIRLLALALVMVAFAGGVTAAQAQTDVSRPAAATVIVPNVVGMRMDRATRTLRSAGLRVNEECSGLFGCIVKSQWWVCSQTPRRGARLARYRVVVIYAERRGEC